jgi:hypothetical protein
MQRPRLYVPFGLVLASAVLAAACSGGMTSPLGPTTNTPTVAGGTTTIKGRTAAMGSTSAVRPSASPATIQVCVSGTSTCANVDGAGNFTITGDFSGDVQLQFVGPQGTVNLVVPDVQPGETVVVTVELNGGTSAIRVESRTGADDAADQDSEDDDSEDDPSEDDDSEDAEDDPSEDDDSEDSEDDDSEDDDSEDDDSEDDDSEDDDSEDDAVTSTGGKR